MRRKSRGRIKRVRGKGRGGKVRRSARGGTGRRGRGLGRGRGRIGVKRGVYGIRGSGITRSSSSRIDPISRKPSKQKPLRKKKQKGWIKLETDYKKINEEIRLLGVEGDFEFCDLLGFNEELCAMIPQPVLAVVLVHPMNAILKEHKNQEDENPQVYKFDNNDVFPNDIFFLRQRIPNSCGTIAVMHSVLCQLSPKDPPKIKLELSEKGPLLNYFQKTRNLRPEEKGEALKNPEFNGIKVVHEKIARMGLQPKRGRGRGRGRRKRKRENRSPMIPKHFTCFVLHDSSRMIVELDGTRNWPIQRGFSSRETFLVDVCKVIMEVYISKCPSNPYDFAALVLKKKRGIL